MAVHQVLVFPMAAIQEPTRRKHGAMDPDASTLSELGSRAPRLRSRTVSDLSPIHNQAMSPAQSIAPPEIAPGTPPRPDASGNGEVLATGMDLLDAQGAAADDASVAGIHVPAPCPRQSTQSPTTHQLQQTLRDSASEQVCAHSSSNDSGDGASVFSNWEANNNPTIVEAVPENGSSDDGQWPEGQWLEGDSHAEGSHDNARDDLSAKRLDAPSEGNAVCDSGLQDLVINTNDPGRADFVMSAGALGNASGTPPDGLQRVSFGERAAGEKCATDGDSNDEGMLVHGGSESSTSCNAPSGFDPTDPEAITALMTQPPEADPRSPVTLTI